MDALARRPLVFGRPRVRRGDRAGDESDPLDGFRAQLALGATGLEAALWRTADGVAIVDERGQVGPALRRKPIGAVTKAALPSDILTFEDLYQLDGGDFELALDVADVTAASIAVHAARSAGGAHRLRRLWLIHPQVDHLAQWRAEWDDVRLINRTRLVNLRHGPERRAAQLAEAGVDAISLHHDDWSRGLVALFHRFGRLAFAFDAQFERVLRELLRMGVDGLSSDHLERMRDLALPPLEQVEGAWRPNPHEGPTNDQ